MQIRRSNQRRRILSLDDTPNTDTCEAPTAARAESSSAPPATPECKTEYSKRARRRYQLRTTDLIPKRAWSLTVVILLLLSAVFGIVLLDNAANSWSDVIGESGVQTLTIGTNTSLSNWFSSFILILTALGCLQIYLLRQHRSDDYRGVYRWWLWMAAILVFASLNAVTGIINIGATLVGHLFSSPENFTVGWGWTLVKFSVLAVLVGRFGYEMRISRGALIGCCVVFFLYSSALIVNAIELPAAAAQQYKLTYGNFMMLGKIAVFAVVLLYSRFIYLEAHGLVKPRVKADKPAKKKSIKKKKKTAQPKPAKSAEKQTAPEKTKRQTQPAAKKKTATPVKKSKSVAAKPTSPAPESSKPKRKSKSSANTDEHDRQLQAEIDELESNQSLSKSERRRLRKLQRRQEQRRAA